MDTRRPYKYGILNFAQRWPRTWSTANEQPKQVRCLQKVTRWHPNHTQRPHNGYTTSYWGYDAVKLCHEGVTWPPDGINASYNHLNIYSIWAIYIIYITYVAAANEAIKFLFTKVFDLFIIYENTNFEMKAIFLIVKLICFIVKSILYNTAETASLFSPCRCLSGLCAPSRYLVCVCQVKTYY